jgi:hypothetical protein
VYTQTGAIAATAIAVLALIGAGRVQAANVAWVSFHNPDGTASAAAAAAGFTEAPDIGYTNLLTSSGHTVTRFVTANDINTNATLLDQLNGPNIDLVIISRSVDSAHYQAAAEASAWLTTVNKPMMIMSGYTLRQSRLGFMADETIPDTTGPVKLLANAPNHPIFANVALDGSNVMVGDFSTELITVNNASISNTVQRGISVNALPIDAMGAGGSLIASLSTGISGTGNLVIAEWAGGTTINKDTGPVTVSQNRLAFLSGSREHNGAPTSQIAGIFDLANDGQTLFKNAVDYLGNLAGEPGDVDGDGDADMNDFNAIRDHFQQSVTSKAQGDLNLDGVVDFKDYRAWKSAFTPAVAGGAAIPEPVAIGMAVVALGALSGMLRGVRTSSTSTTLVRKSRLCR